MGLTTNDIKTIQNIKTNDIKTVKITKQMIFKQFKTNYIKTIQFAETNGHANK